MTTTIYLIRHAEAEGTLYRIAQGHTDGKITKKRMGTDQSLIQTVSIYPCRFGLLK